MTQPNAVEKLLNSRRVIVCCGSGGVGKTTTSAALAMRAAVAGKRTVVITIDPAKRLATSLGLKALSPDATDLTDRLNEGLTKVGQGRLKGRFFAVMPDTAQTFEKFVRSMAGENEGLARRVLRTSIYKIFAQDFAGTNEYMAMEKLFELYNEKSYDLIVLDTPPSANTRVFLEAPNMLAGFFDDKIMKFFINPGSKLVATGIRKLLEVLEKLTGRGFISDLIEFTEALFELRSSFIENLRRVGDLLHQQDVAFLMVTSPERLSKADTQDFVHLISERGYHFWGFVVNRVLGRRIGIDPRDELSVNVLGKKLSETNTVSESEIDLLKKNFSKLEPTLDHERDAFAFLSRLAGQNALGTGKNVVFVPEQKEDVHSVEALLKLSTDLA